MIIFVSTMRKSQCCKRRTENITQMKKYCKYHRTVHEITPQKIEWSNGNCFSLVSSESIA